MKIKELFLGQILFELFELRAAAYLPTFHLLIIEISVLSPAFHEYSLLLKNYSVSESMQLLQFVYSFENFIGRSIIKNG